MDAVDDVVGLDASAVMEESSAVRVWRSILTGDKFRYLIAFLMCYPFAYIHKHYTTSETQRHWFSIICGTVMAYYVFGWDFLHFVLSSLGVYIICWLCPRRYAPWISFVFCMLYVSYGHIYRQYYLYLSASRDWTSPQMMLTIKLTSFAWCYRDGGMEDQQLSSRQKALKVEKLPGLVPWFSYIFFMCGFLGGPPAEFRQYIAFSDRSMFAAEGGKIPSARSHVLKRSIATAVALLMFIGHKKMPELYMITPGFREMGFWTRHMYGFIALELTMWKYYFAFFLGEAVCGLSGLAYNGRDEKGQVKWNGVEMLRLLAFKTAVTPKALTANWNVAAANWLQRYIFLRIVPRRPVLAEKASEAEKAVYEAEKKRLWRYTQFAYMITFLASACWHGFYPGYYMLFLGLGMWGVVAKVFIDYIEPFLPEKTPGWLLFVQWWSLYVTIAYHNVAFQLRDFHYGMTALSAIYYSSTVVCLTVMLVEILLHLVGITPSSVKAWDARRRQQKAKKQE